MLLIKHDKSFHLLYVLIVLLLLMKLVPAFISGVKGATFGCIERERQALLKFKDGIIDDSGSLSTWGSEEEKRDCCKWRGVGCNNRTGHVTHLDHHQGNAYQYFGQYLTAYIFNIGSLSQLEELNVGGNSLQRVMSAAHFSNLSKLTVLDLTDNSLALKFESNWAPSFQLVHISLSSCDLGPRFPQWLRNQNNFVKLHISNTRISDTIPNWFWNLSNSNLEYLNLSHNKMSGILPDFSSKYSNLKSIDLSSNQFEGPLPHFSSNTASTLFLSYNKFSGPASFLCNIGSDTFSVLDLSNNLLTGWIPNCLMNFTSLNILNLASNNFSGKIPSSIGSMLNLQTLSLHNNSFVGELPLSLRNCSHLVFLDLSSNKLRGEIPGWIGESMPSLKILSLQSNGFSGSIPPNLCHLSNILILDLSLNNISGVIPKCLNNLTSMVQKTESEYSLANNAVLSTCSAYSYKRDYYQNEIRVGWKRREDVYGSTLGLLRTIDFAGNKLKGEIPEEITGLLLLLALNLSGNNLTGEIPQKIGQLKQLESLDLSGNQLSGVIPITMADLSFLAFLDLSNNHLSGRIPLSTQLQVFNASQFTGNLALCVQPFLQKCPEDETNQSPPANDDNRGEEVVADEFMKWFCTAMGIGFSVFFWGVSSALLLKSSWRHAYFRFLDESWDWLCVKVLFVRLVRIVCATIKNLVFAGATVGETDRHFLANNKSSIMAQMVATHGLHHFCQWWVQLPFNNGTLLLRHKLAFYSSSKLTIPRVSVAKFTGTRQTFQSPESPKHTLAHTK
ncbi:hypothetical protein NC651_033321 [Populus alba x Populus x berolinensis]|nr:hypothetical protein NC651_033321 [Populus alba x Populus x berolinensis]